MFFFLFRHTVLGAGGGRGVLVDVGSRYDLKQVVVTLPQRRNGLVPAPVVVAPPIDPPAPIIPPAPAGMPKIGWGGTATPGPSRDEPAGARGECPL